MHIACHSCIRRGYHLVHVECYSIPKSSQSHSSGEGNSLKWRACSWTSFLPFLCGKLIAQCLWCPLFLAVFWFILYHVHVVTIVFCCLEVVCFTSIYQCPDSPVPLLVRPDTSCSMESWDPWQWGSPLPHTQPWWTSVGERWGNLSLPVKADLCLHKLCLQFPLHLCLPNA